MLDRLQDVFKCLEKNEVKYLVIGGIAAVLYGVPRATFDLDILIETNIENAKKLLSAFAEAKLGTALLITPEELLSNEITIFEDYVRIDVQTMTPGINFNSAWKRKVKMRFKEQNFWVLSRKDLIEAKKASGREIDLQDVKILESGEIK